MALVVIEVDSEEVEEASEEEVSAGEVGSEEIEVDLAAVVIEVASEEGSAEEIVEVEEGSEVALAEIKVEVEASEVVAVGSISTKLGSRIRATAAVVEEAGWAVVVLAEGEGSKVVVEVAMGKSSNY